MAKGTDRPTGALSGNIIPFPCRRPAPNPDDSNLVQILERVSDFWNRMSDDDPFFDGGRRMMERAALQKARAASRTLRVAAALARHLSGEA